MVCLINSLIHYTGMQHSRHGLSLITYNIHKGFGVGRLRFLLPKMREALSQLNPDFVLLQEVQGLHKLREKRINNWPEAPQFEYMAEKMWPHFLYAKNAVYQSGHHGNAILSKYPFIASENINLSTMHRASRSMLHGKISLTRGEMTTTLHVLCVHLGLFKAERSSQCETLISHLTANVPAHEPLLMAGDFNDWRNSLSTPLAEELHIKEAFFSLEGKYARSYPAIRPALRVDRIYFRGLQVKEVKCLQGKPWRMLSDHVPLFARFEWEPEGKLGD